MLLELLITGGIAYATRTYREYQTEAPKPEKNLPQVTNHSGSEAASVAIPNEPVDNTDEFEIQQIHEDFIISSASLALSLAGLVAYTPLFLLSVPGWIYVSIPAFQQAFKLLKAQKVDVNTIFTITFVGCAASGFFFTGNLAAFFYVASKKLFLKLRRDSKQSLIDVFSQHPKFVWVVTGNTEVKVPFEALKQDDIVVVGAGETIPADGVVTEGYASVDQHILTGEAQPVEKEVGSSVFAATIVLAGKVYIKVEKAGEESTAAQIGQILNQTTHHKTGGQLRAEALTAQTLVPTLIAGGVAVPFIGPIGAITVINSHFGYRMAVVASIVTLSYLQVIARKGILVKNGEVLDILPDVDTIVFDKTGTLTLAQPTLGTIHVLPGYSENEVLVLAAAAEYKQTHPIALAILEAATQRGLHVPEVEERAYQVGYGLSVQVAGQHIRLGSIRFIERENLNIAPQFQAVAETAHHEGHSLILLARDAEVIAAIELFPTVRPEAKEVIQSLKRQRLIKYTYILSGDNDAPTRKLASELGMDGYYAGVLPQNKADIIEELQVSGKTVCFIGDGINDSIALKKAQVSISLRGASTIATDTAQIILMNENLTQLSHLFELAKEFDDSMENSYYSILTPSMISAGGTLLMGFTLLDTIVLKQIGLILSLGIATHPLLQHHTKTEQETEVQSG